MRVPGVSRRFGKFRHGVPVLLLLTGQHIVLHFCRTTLLSLLGSADFRWCCLGSSGVLGYLFVVRVVPLASGDRNILPKVDIEAPLRSTAFQHLVGARHSKMYKCKSVENMPITIDQNSEVMRLAIIMLLRVTDSTNRRYLGRGESQRGVPTVWRE